MRFDFKACECVLSCFSCVRLFVTPWTAARQAPLSMEFSRQAYWSGLLCPPSGDLPNPGSEPVSLTSTCIGRWVLYHQRHLGSPPASNSAMLIAEMASWLLCSPGLWSLETESPASGVDWEGGMQLGIGWEVSWLSQTLIPKQWVLVARA